MTKRRVTFEVDNVELFDRLREMKGDTGPIGERLVGALLTDNVGFAETAGMAVYGITLVPTHKTDA